MAAWTEAELDRIGSAQELRLQSERRDGTLRDPVTMWVVRESAGIYICSVRGREGAWFRGTQTRSQGRINAGGISRDVRFEDADPGRLDAVAAAYRTKYAAYPDIIERSLTPLAFAATLELVPR
ncbi:DUF2255 family protein [Nocardia sp. NEAU-G5]|uniref:DUF2255 family protein n=1 Tax=Nocardia albiluteola TaxID=2842303 RepID=A0ABS6B2A7_9NOCA|nr:DUF2255 family protein [Nocardia albiluteola]MBU3064268.1 DUF2255 family protein [Nocardia albiluteola]